MKIAISAALVLGAAHYAAAFPCTWNGAGSSYVYLKYNVDTNACCACNCGSNCNQNCVCDLDNDWGQTTCCRCATEGECEQAPPSDWTQDSNTWQGCDLYAPDVFIGDAVEAASAPGMWFTSPNQLWAFLEATVTCTDDCTPEPTCVKTVNYPPTDAGNCEAYVTVFSQDRDFNAANCVNVNTESKSFYVRYDEVAPTVTVTLGTFLPKKSADGRKYEDIPLTITVGDNCDVNPEVTITVFSDETSVTHDFDDKPAAVLERKYSNIGPNGVLQGWGLTLDRYSYARKMCGPSMECYEADGRFYTVRVCAKDYAGWTTCAEKSVGVPLKPTELKHIVPENQGKLFVVAEDAGFWNAVPTEIPFRNENIFLAMQPSNYQQAKLCWANYYLDDGDDDLSWQLLNGDYNNDQCWRACGTTAGCRGYQINYNNGDCYLVYQFGSLEYNGGTGMPDVWTGVNIYAMADEVCPDKNISRNYQ